MRVQGCFQSPYIVFLVWNWFPMHVISFHFLLSDLVFPNHLTLILFELQHLKGLVGFHFCLFVYIKRFYLWIGYEKDIIYWRKVG